MSISLTNNGVTLCYIPDDKIDTQSVLSYLNSQTGAGKKLYLTTESYPQKMPTDITMKNLGVEFGIDHIVDHNLSVKKDTSSLLNKLLAEYDYLIFDESESLIEMLVTDDIQKRGYLRGQIIDTLVSLSFDAKAGNVLLLTRSMDMARYAKANLMSGSGRQYTEIGNTPKAAHEDNTPFFEENGGFFAETEPKIPKVNLQRIDQIIYSNNATFGDVVFFSNEEKPMMTRFAIDAIVPNAPIMERVCYIAPFRSIAEVKNSLKKLHSVYPLKERAVKRTSFYTSECLKGKRLDTSNALMVMIKDSLCAFGAILRDSGAQQGICVLDTTGMDNYGAEIDHPSLRWHAKANNLLIIVGADTAEDRYTYKRQAHIEIKSQITLPSPE